MLFRLFRRKDHAYYQRRCPVSQLFAVSYENSARYPRLVPNNGESSATIANLRVDCKRAVKRVINRTLLLQGKGRALIGMEELDMVACHTGIYAGLMGEKGAPTWGDAYHSGSSWSHVLSRGGGLPTFCKSQNDLKGRHS